MALGGRVPGHPDPWISGPLETNTSPACTCCEEYCHVLVVPTTDSRQCIDMILALRDGQGRTSNSYKHTRAINTSVNQPVTLCQLTHSNTATTTRKQCQQQQRRWNWDSRLATETRRQRLVEMPTTHTRVTSVTWSAVSRGQVCHVVVSWEVVGTCRPRVDSLTTWHVTTTTPHRTHQHAHAPRPIPSLRIF